MSGGSKRLNRYTFDPDRPQLQAPDSDEMNPLLGSQQSDAAPTMTSKGMFRMFACSFIATIGSLIFGYCLGFSSPALVDPLLVKDILGESAQNWFSSIINIGAAIGGVSTSAIAVKFGRKGTIMFAGLPYAIGWLLVLLPAYLHTLDGVSNSLLVSLLLVGRALSGAGLGIASGIISIYISEIATPAYRGFLGTCFQLSVTIGLLLSYLLGRELAHYPWLATVALVLTASLVVLGLWIPESPRALLLKNRPDEARRSLEWLRGGPGVDVGRELQDIEKTLMDQEPFALGELSKPTVWKPFAVALGLMFFQQFSGINAVAFYASVIFDGVGSSFQEKNGPLIIAVDQVIATAIAALVMDKLGRRKLLVLSGTLQCLSIVALGVFFQVNHCLNVKESSDPPCTSSPEVGPLSLVALIVYMTGFSFGWGAIPWLLMSEILPSKARTIAGGVCTFFVWMCSFAVTYMFNSLTTLIHKNGTFYFFGGWAFASVIFVLLFVPETKGKTLEDIELYFERGNRSAINDDS